MTFLLPRLLGNLRFMADYPMMDPGIYGEILVYRSYFTPIYG